AASRHGQVAKQVLQLGQQQDQEPTAAAAARLPRAAAPGRAALAAPQAVPQASSAASASCGPATASCFSASSGSPARRQRQHQRPHPRLPRAEGTRLRGPLQRTWLVAAQTARHVPPGLLRRRRRGARRGAARLFGLVRVGRRGLLLRLLGRGGRRVVVLLLRLPAPLPQQQRAAARHAGRGTLHLPSTASSKWRARRAAGPGTPGGACAGGRTWSPTACGGKKLLNKCAASAAEESGAGKKDKVTIADDYSDPFDAKNDLKSKAGKGESAGYMEPYEAQRIMTEFQRQESVRSQHKGIQLYDTPYEPEGQSIDSDSESTVSPRLRESKLPQDDDRPADEYDQPWEWNRVTIPALAAQFNGNEKRQSSPSPSRDRRRQLRAPGGGFKPIKHGSPEFCGILGERVDPAVPLEKQIWYHGAISRGDAENLLRLCKECSYLVRNSQTSKHDYSLSLRSNQGFMHMKLAKTKEKYILGQNSPPFDSVPEVIHYYTTRKLPIKGAEHLSLLYPVAVRTL
uniref:SH2 domain containing adaptor protein B n=2 Tax=Macaca fascicularis TaxID=9541 RepID=A0A2K5UG19_MACFA